MKQFLEKAKTWGKPVLNWIVFCTSCIAAFFIGFYYTPIQKSLQKDQEPKINIGIQIRNNVEYTISVTDRGELLFLNRASGNIDLYEESVGLAVFKAYGTRITSNQPK